MKEESYNIHDIISFKLVNDCKFGGFLQTINPEYEYFRVDERIEPCFRITVTDKIITASKNINVKYKFRKDYNKWKVEIIEYKNGFIDLIIVPKLKGIRKLISYTALKNVYVRSLIYYCLINKGSTLLHASGINLNDKAYLFVGRPGVFKTSLLMDFMRKTKATFLGEENVLIHDGYIYGFPFHIRSLNYRIKHYKNEDAQTQLQKILQVLSLFSKIDIKLPISENCKLKKLFYIEKDTNFSCKKTTFNNIVNNLIKNEYSELSIKCNHRLSAGINDNYFIDYVKEKGMEKAIIMGLRKIFNRNVKNVDLYKIKMPNIYSSDIINFFLKEICE